MTDSLLVRLRDETSEAHRLLEHQLDLMSPALTRGRYIALLQGFYGYVQPWEARLHLQLPARLQGFAAPRAKAHLLADDLEALGRSRASIAALPRCSALPDLGDLAAQLGSMYVMEGSSLGGRIIGPQVARRLQLPAGVGASYFDAYGPRTGSMWQAFRQRLALELSDSSDHDAAIESARATFHGLQHWFAGIGSPQAA